MFRKFFITLASLIISCSCYAGGLQKDINWATCALENSCIPPEVLQNACGVAFLHVVKAGFIFSGRIGSGLVVAKTANGWSAPSAIGTGGAGFGLQVGAKVTDFILILNTQAALDAFSGGGSLTLGGSLSVAVGPVGRTAEGSLVLPPAAIYSYSKSKGAFAGISLEGTVIIERSRANADFYGRPVCPSELLSGQVARPKSADSLYRELNRCQN